MGRIKINNELLRIMDDYNLFMSSCKNTVMPIFVTKEKPNHKTSLYKEQMLVSDKPFGYTSIDCEIRDKNLLNYSFQILSNRLNNRVLSRLDEGNGVHRNNIPDIPLAEQVVSTPHFHKYDSYGRFLAYKTDSLNSYNEKPLEIEEGFRIFCEEEMISSIDGSPSRIEIKEDGVLPFDYDNDPLAGISF